MPAMTDLVFHEQAWEDYQHWLTQDPRTLRRINALIKDCLRDPFDGIGKPEPLRYLPAGYWSRRIDRANRLVYKVAEDSIIIASCRSHYT